MNNNNAEKMNREAKNTPDEIKIKTPNTTYSFTQSWVENKALNDILVDLIADDFSKHHNNMQ